MLGLSLGLTLGAGSGGAAHGTIGDFTESVEYQIGTIYEAAIPIEPTPLSVSKIGGDSFLSASIVSSNILRITSSQMVYAPDQAEIEVLVESADEAQSAQFTITLISITEASVPDAVDDLVATPGDTEVVLAWSAPFNGGSAITDYVVEYKLTSEPTVWTTFPDGTSASTGATVTGLTNDLGYDFRVKAVNAVGTSAASNVDSATPESGVVTIDDLVPIVFPTGILGPLYVPEIALLTTDSAGSTPLTAFGQSIGMMKDKRQSVLGGTAINASQSTSGFRPIFARAPVVGVRNRLIYTEDFTNAAWVKATSGTGTLPVITANAGTDPDGGSTATRIQLSKGAGTSNTDYSTVNQTPPVNTAQMTGSIWVKTNDGTTKSVVFRIGASGESTTAVSVNGTWQRITVTGSSSSVLEISLRGDWTGTSASADLLVWHPQKELGASATDYQKVVTAYEVTEAGVDNVDHFRFDGDDDFMPFTFTGPNPCTMVAAVWCEDLLRFVLASNTTNGSNQSDFAVLSWDGFGGTGIGIADTHIDGVLFSSATASRDQMYDAIAFQGWVLLEIRSADFSSWTGAKIGTIGAFTGFEFLGNLAVFMMFEDGPDPAAQKVAARSIAQICTAGATP